MIEEPFRLSEIQNTRKKIECPKCGSISEKFQVPGFDKSNPDYYRCTNTDCLFVGKYFVFIKKSANPGPLGSVENVLNKEPNYTVIQTRRSLDNRMRSGSSNRRKYSSEPEGIPKFGNREDIELKAMLENGILVNLIDDPQDNVDGNLDDNYNYSE